jgi:hypothetical protein
MERETCMVEKYSRFLKENENQFWEWAKWKKETKLECITVLGQVMAVKNVYFRHYCLWRMEQDLNAENTEGVIIEVETPLFEVLN